MSAPSRYPLAWPAGWPRSRPPSGQRSGNFKISFDKALKELGDEIERMSSQHGRGSTASSGWSVSLALLPADLAM
jgi:hypothetical protein